MLVLNTINLSLKCLVFQTYDGGPKVINALPDPEHVIDGSLSSQEQHLLWSTSAQNLTTPASAILDI